MDVISYATSGLSILLHGVITLQDEMSCDKSYSKSAFPRVLSGLTV